MVNLTEKLSFQHELKSQIKNSVENFRKMQEHFNNLLSQEEFDSYLASLESKYGIGLACEVAREIYTISSARDLVFGTQKKYLAKFGD